MRRWLLNSALVGRQLGGRRKFRASDMERLVELADALGIVLGLVL